MSALKKLTSDVQEKNPAGGPRPGTAGGPRDALLPGSDAFTTPSRRSRIDPPFGRTTGGVGRVLQRGADRRVALAEPLGKRVDTHPLPLELAHLVGVVFGPARPRDLPGQFLPGECRGAE